MILNDSENACVCLLIKVTLIRFLICLTVVDLKYIHYECYTFAIHDTPIFACFNKLYIQEEFSHLRCGDMGLDSLVSFSSSVVFLHDRMHCIITKI